MTRAPDLVEPVLGYRAWQVNQDGVLGSLAWMHAWPEGVTTAECVRGKRDHRHRAPVHNCDCGIYAYTRLDSRLLAFNCIGVIAAWGAIELHERGDDVVGFRAEHACPLALAATRVASKTDRAAMIRAASRHNVRLVGVGRLEAEGRRHARPLVAPPPRQRERVLASHLWEDPETGEFHYRQASRRFKLPEGLRYDPDLHVWMEREGELLRIGVTAVMADVIAAGPEVQEWAAGETPAGGVLATIDGRAGGTVVVRAPVACEVAEFNPLMRIVPRLTRTNPYSKGWLARIRPLQGARPSAAPGVGASRYRRFIDQGMDPLRAGGSVFERVSGRRCGAGGRVRPEVATRPPWLPSVRRALGRFDDEQPTSTLPPRPAGALTAGQASASRGLTG